MDDLVAWLREQITEKRRRAMRTQWTADGPPAAWTYSRERFRVTTLDPSGNAQGVASRRAGIGADGQPYDDVLLDVDGEHMELNDPRSAVAECDAHDEIINKYEGASFTLQAHPEHVANNGYVLGASAAVIALALAYRHRPGYREEWKP